MNAIANTDSNKIVETVEGIEFTIENYRKGFSIIAKRLSNRAKSGYKVLFYEAYQTLDLALDRKARFLLNLKKLKLEKQMKTDFIKNQKANFKLELGSIFYESWGYDQTNIDFYQVVNINKSKITLREVNQDRTEDLFMQGDCSARKDDFKKFKPIEKRLMFLATQEGLKPYFKGISTCMFLWDGKPKRWSNYA
jgi:hypothetical protein